jgi:hypothetical protein
MLGESVVIVPKDAGSDGKFFNLLSEELEVAGLSTFRSRVGPLV